MLCSLAARALGCFCVNNKSLQLLALEVLPFTFSHSCSPPHLRMHCLLQLGAMQRLHRMLASPMLHMKQHAAQSISLLCSTNPMAQLAATEAGTLLLVQDLFRSNRTEVLVTGLRFIFNLACVTSAISLHQSFSEPSAGCFVQKKIITCLQVRQHQSAGAIFKTRCTE